MPTITMTDATQIYFKDWGKGQPMVFSHGWPLSADAWDDQMVYLASRGYRCIPMTAAATGDQASPGMGTRWIPTPATWQLSPKRWTCATQSMSVTPLDLFLPGIRTSTSATPGLQPPFSASAGSTRLARTAGKNIANTVTPSTKTPATMRVARLLTSTS